MSLLEATRLSVDLGRRPVLDRVDFTLAQGELIGLIGPNGAGKTTLARALCGLQQASAGEVALEGQLLHEWPRDALARTLAYLPQSGGVHWEVTVEALVALGRLPHRGSWQRACAADHAAVERALEVTDTAGFRSRTVAELSGGERARVLLARALAGEPRILLADEPVANLDPYYRLEVMEHLQQQARAGMAVMVVLHDLTLATRFCSRLVLLDQGRVFASGAPREVTSAATLAHCFRIEVHRGDLPDGPYVVPTARVTAGAAHPAARSHQAVAGTGRDV